MMIPCIDREALKLLVGTADERFQYSPEYFRKTHFPQIMHRYYKSQLTAEVTEQELLYELKEVDSSGNRVYFIFGSTGAGKSELLCWIKDNWETSGVDRPVIRISRSELNPQILIKKCYESIGATLNVKIDETRWDLLLKKPITLINQLVWTTLAEFLHSDEEIVPTALLIRPVIEKNITAFTKQVEKGNIKKPLEIITVEQFQEIITNTTVQIPIEYSLLEQSLVHKLDQFLFEGWEISALFKQLSKILKEQDIRPLLLIDDLVQSVNIYATEILDHLITLEEGNWDVVIGLTPGALQDNARGSELTERIQNLDTFDDRVRKFWLSDEKGKAFYNLNRSQVIPYMSNYLKELKVSRGFQCSQSCGHFNNCKKFIPTSFGTNNEVEEISLLPLNSPLVKRIYDGIPIGKSKLRYMILNSKEIVRFLQKGDRRQLDRIHPLVSREVFAEHSDILIKSLAEWYSREDAPEVIISKPLLKHFGYDDFEANVNLHSLETKQITEDITLSNQVDLKVDDHRLKIRDWVEGRSINEQLLEPIRLGVSCLVNDVVKATNMSRRFTPRSSVVLRRTEIENRTRYPIILFEDTSNGLTIDVRRGYSALQITDFQTLKPTDKARKFLQIANELDAARWVYQAEEMHEIWKNQFELELGVTLPMLVMQLRNWVYQWHQVGDIIWETPINSPFTKSIIEITEGMFQDWYLLRDNMMDYNTIQYSKGTKWNFESWFLNLKIPRFFEQYQSNSLSFYVFFSQLQMDFRLYREQITEAFAQEVEKKKEYLFYLNTKDCSESKRCKEILENLSNRANNHNILISLDFLKEWNTVIERCGFKIEFEGLRLKRAEIIEKFNNFKYLEKKVIVLCKEITGVQLPQLLMEFDPGWVMLDTESSKWTAVSDSLEVIHYTLLMTPRNVVKRLLDSDVQSQINKNIQLLWTRIYDYIKQLQLGLEVNSDIKHYITSWETTNFHQAEAEWNEQLKRNNEINELLDKVKKDFGIESPTSAEKLIQCIIDNNEVRPAIKRQLINLLEKGYSTLPPSQWRKLVEELSERFPMLFASVRLQLVVAKDLS